MSGKSSKPEKPAKPVAVVNGQPVVVGQKQEVTAASGTKFTLKDLIGLGENPKLSRKQSSYKGSDRGSTKGGSDRGDGDNGSTASLLKKYGVCDKAAIGKGATAVVRLAHKWDRREEKLYAVKEFRKRRKNETEKDYVKKLTSEFCISSTLHHPNIVETVDLVQDEAQHWCEVMEYCPGGDLYAAIKKGGMSSGEVECSFKQVLLGIQYLHSMGVAHRDIKPENLLLDGRGHVKVSQLSGSRNSEADD
jgi:protein-serine/threonine kinase